MRRSLTSHKTVRTGILQVKAAVRRHVWNDSDLDQLKNVPGTAFEVVETGKILRESGL